MKKILTISFLIFALFINNNCYANEFGFITDEPTINTSSWDKKALKRAPYLIYYDINEINNGTINGYNLNIEFHVFTKEEYKNLSKWQKKDYKKHKHLFQQTLRGNYYPAMRFEPYYIPYLIYKYNSAKRNKDYKTQNEILEIFVYYSQYDIFSYDIMASSLVFLNWINENYYRAFILATKEREKYYKNCTSKDDYFYFLTAVITEYYYKNKNYDKAIWEGQKISKSDDLYINGIIPEILYLSYFNKKNYTKAFEITQLMIPKHYNYTWLMRGINSAPNDKIKLSYIYKILEGNFDSSEKYAASLRLTSIKDKEIKKISNSINGYFVPPLWEDISKERNKYISITSEIKQQRDFYAQIDKCIYTYKGNNLKTALSEIKRNEEKKTNQIVLNARNMQERLEKMQIIQELQFMNSNLMEQNYQLNKIYNSTKYYTNPYNY